MGETCHLARVRNQLAGNRGRHEEQQQPELFHFGIGRSAISQTKGHTDRFEQFTDLDGLHDSPMRNVVSYMESNNESRGKVITPENIVLGLFSEQHFNEIVDDYCRDYSNKSARHKRKKARELATEIKRSFAQLADDDAANQLANIVTKTEESTGVEIDSDTQYVVDPGPQDKNVSKRVCLETRYSDLGNGLLGVSLDVSDKDTRHMLEEDLAYINRVLDGAGLGEYRYTSFTELGTAIPLFQKSNKPNSREFRFINTPEIPPAIEVAPLAIVS